MNPLCPEGASSILLGEIERRLYVMVQLSKGNSQLGWNYPRNSNTSGISQWHWEKRSLEESWTRSTVAVMNVNRRQSPGKRLLSYIQFWPLLNDVDAGLIIISVYLESWNGLKDFDFAICFQLTFHCIISSSGTQHASLDEQILFRLTSKMRDCKPKKVASCI